MPPRTRDSETQTALPPTQGSIEIDSFDPADPPGSQWARAQLPLLRKILSRLSGTELTPHQRVQTLRTLRQPLTELVRALFQLEESQRDPKVATLHPAPSDGQQLLDQMCQSLDHLLLTLDRRRFRTSETIEGDRRWTIRQLLLSLGYQIEHGILAERPWPPRTWQRLHDLFAYLIERDGLRLGSGDSGLGRAFDPETLYKRLLLLGLCTGLRGARRLDSEVSNQLTRWAVETRLDQPTAHLGECGLILVETSKDSPAHWQRHPLSHPWRGWVLEAPQGFLAFAGFQRSPLSLWDSNHHAQSLVGARR